MVSINRAAPIRSILAKIGLPPQPLPMRILGALLVVAATVVQHRRSSPSTTLPEIPRGRASKSGAVTLARRVGASRRREREEERGRSAESPAQIPARGWKDVLWRVYEQISEDRVTLVAAGVTVTYFVVLALFPGIAAFVALYGMVADSSTLGTHLESLKGVLPEGAINVVADQLNAIVSRPKTTLGVASLASLALGLWSANAGTKSMFDALNLVYSEKEKRSFIKLNAVSLAFTIGLIIFGALALGAMTILPTVLPAFGLGGTGELIIKIARWPVLLVAVGLILAILYRFGPSREQPRWQWVSPGSAFAAVVWLITSLAFSFYAENFGSYNATYGALGALIGFMVWLWLSAIVVLVGAELNAELEHQTAKDTTTGPERPKGARGAAMADRVGPAKT
jgi:membrane protein